MCGIVGISSQQNVAVELYDSLIHLQHRGQDAAGIITQDHDFHYQHGKGLAREIFTAENLEKMRGNQGIAHVRYPTAGGNSLQEIQPFFSTHPCRLALAHNGNLVNQQSLTEELLCKSQVLQSSSDSELLLHLFANALGQLSPKLSSTEVFAKLVTAAQSIQQKVQGSYAIVMLIANHGLVAFRDPHGIRPLVVGERLATNHIKDIIFASEPTSFYSLGFKQVEDVAAGELVFVSHDGRLQRKIIGHPKLNPCVFEYVYFARPDAKLNEVSVYRARLRMGQNLAKQWRQQYPNCLPDIVIPAPFTANTAALAFAHELGVRYSEGLYKNPFIGRTFIMPSQRQRKKLVRYKLTPQATEIRNKKVLIVDDSIVRGTTSREIVRMIKEYQAKEVYFASASPPIISPCFYGIDTPSKADLIAANKTIDEIKAYLGVDQLLYQNIKDLEEAVLRRGDHHIDSLCLGCMNGCYVTGNINKETLERLEQQRYHRTETTS